MHEPPEELPDELPPLLELDDELPPLELLEVHCPSIIELLFKLTQRG